MGSWAKREDTQKKQTNGETKTNEHPATPNKSKSETDRTKGRLRTGGLDAAAGMGSEGLSVISWVGGGWNTLAFLLKA